MLISDDDPPPAIDRALRHLVDQAATRRLEPLDEAGVEGIVELYGRDVDGPRPIRAVMEASGGSPARIHALAAQWAQGEFAQRLGGATTRAAEGRRDLRRLEAEVASNLIDLQFARERSQLLASEPRTRSADVCPFLGLASFDVDDADLFFGRERLVAEMVGRLAGAPFLGVVGPSGSGKSSALRAGLLPTLQSGALPGSERWLRVLLRPGAEPMRELDRVVFAALDEPLRERLPRVADPLAAAAAVLPEDDRILVVVDQFEEIFTATTDPAQRQAFVTALTDAAASGRAIVLVAVRADFYGRFAEFEALAGLLGANHVLVGPMSADEYRRAIEGPVRRSGLRIDAGLVDRLVADVVNQPGGLPLLSTALVELWQKRDGRSLTVEAYEESGGVSGAVARLAEAAYGGLSEDQKSTARSLFLRLASGGGESVVRRRVPLSELDAATNETVRETLRVLTRARLLTVDEGTVEVAHEALLREWPRLAGWLEEDREGQRLRAHLAEAAREWEGTSQDPSELYRGARLASALDWTAEHTLELNELERRFVTESRTADEREAQRQARANRRLRALLAGALVALIVAASAGGLAYVQRQAADQATNDAQAQRASAEKAAADADTQRANAEQAATDADAQRLGAQALATKDLSLSLLLARQGLALADSAPVRADLLADLSRSPAALRISRPLPGRPQQVQASADGRTLMVSDNSDAMAVIDTASGRTLYVHQSNPEPTTFDSPGMAADGTPFIATFGPEGAWITELARDSDQRDANGDVPGPERVDWRLVARSLDDRGGDARRAAGRRVRQHDAEGRSAHRGSGGDDDLERQRVRRGAPSAHRDAGCPGPRIGSTAPGSRRGGGRRAVRPSPRTTLPKRATRYSVSPDGATLALDNVPADGHETLVDLRTGRSREVAGQHTAAIFSSSFSPDSRILVTGGGDLVARVWDVRTGALLQTLAGHDGAVRALAVTAVDGEETAWTVSLDGSLIAWDLTGNRRFGREFNGASGVDTLALGNVPQPAISSSPDGRFLALSASDGAVIVDAATHAVVRHLRTVTTGASSAEAWSPDGTRLAVTGDEKSVVTLYDTSTWSPVGGGPLVGPSPAAAAVAPARTRPSGRSPSRRTRRGWSPAPPVSSGRGTRGAERRSERRSRPRQTSCAVAIDPTTGWIAAGLAGLPGKAVVFAPGSVAPRYSVDVDDAPGTYAVAFSPDGKTLATGGGTGDVRLWDASDGAPIGRPVKASAGFVTSISWGADGQQLLTGGTDGTVRLIDVASQSVSGSLPGESDQHVGVTYSSDGRDVLASYDSGSAFDWQIGTADWASTACAVAGRTLTQDEWAQYLPGRPYQPACTP